MIIRKADAETEAGTLPWPELLEAMSAYNDELAKAGVLLDGMGLQPSVKGAKIAFNGGKPTVSDGPFTEAKELIAGFTLIQTSTREEAIEWVKRWPAIDGHGEVQLELRQVYELEDFGDVVTPEMHDRFEQTFEQATQNR
jgi:hypothetical protein